MATLGLDAGGSREAATNGSPGPGGWRTTVVELAGFDRPSASEGERRAAEIIARRLSELGCSAAVEEERAHGTYWWPVGLANVISTAAAALALSRMRPVRRAVAAAIAGAAAAALWDDLGQDRRWFRKLLPHRPTWNVVAETGDPTAQRTVVLVAHHDAAHSGLIFHPALPRIAPRLAPNLHRRSKQSLPILYGVWLGPALVCAGALLGARRLLKAGAAVAVGATAAMVDIGARSVVPGANDNLSSVGVLIALAARLLERPVEGVRVVLVSTGSEESFSEGMEAFGRRHFGELDRATTEIVCLECLGGPTLMALEGEGMLRMRHYPERMRDALVQAGAEAGVTVSRGLRTVAATDALVALRESYQVATLASVDYTKFPSNYHWPSDTPEALDWRTIEAAISVCERFVRRTDIGVN